MQRAGEEFLSRLAASAREAVAMGRYEVDRHPSPRRSLRRAIAATNFLPIIAEVKYRSPAEGPIRRAEGAAGMARLYARGGAVAISVLTEEKHFEGRLGFVPDVKDAVGIPVLMKDIFLDPVQIDAAERIGADAVLLIAGLFTRALSAASLQEMIAHSHSRGLEVLLETHTAEEYLMAGQTEADLVGINNRNLDTLEVSLDTSYRLLGSYPRVKPVVCESGIKTRKEAVSLIKAGANALLIGSTLMRSRDPTESIRRLAGA
ncbi:MAG: indole-3-glycerol-phosphate synthase [Thaumarchaeota archaeon]|nr:MAG: indole-3-glycerol-phosphate synthase [Nitrososphaerota archaeon]TMP99681.1 MAG: indole-3-glycerol-phosphate synthase [Nitrososphaerota archaeon]